MTQTPTRLFVPVGLPGCGKSTFGYNLFGFGLADIHSTDQIRADMSSVDDQTQNKDVFAEFHALIGTSLANRSHVYADATNLDMHARDTLGRIAREHHAEVHCFLFTNVKEAIIRNSQRTRRVPDDVMLRFIYKLEECLKSIPHEPFTSVTRIDGVQGTSPYATYL